MILKILIVLVGLISVFFIIASFQSEEFKISRSITISTTPDKVFAQVNNLHLMQNWNPWNKLDPNLKLTYEGPDSGVGAACSWVGNSKAGAGKMTIVKSQSSEVLEMQLDFLKPMKATNAANYTFKVEGQGTAVTWSMSGKKNLMMKAFHMVVNMEKMLGPDFEKGLAQLKANTESAK